MKVIFFANTDWYLFNFRLALAKVLLRSGAEVVMVSPPGSYGRKLEAEGFRWIKVPMARRSLNPLREAWLLWRLIRVYQEERPDIVHHFTIKCVVYGGIAARLVGIHGIVGAVAGMGYIFSNDRLLSRILRPLIRVLMSAAQGGRNCRLILQNCDDRDAFISEKTVAPCSLRLIPGSGVDTTRFSPVSRPKDSHRARKVLLAARLVWEKGIAEYVAAARQFKREGRNVEFLLAGEPDEGNPNSVQATLVDKWHAEQIIKPLGHVGDIAALLSEIDVMVLPSFYREGVPRSLIEAASCGLPLVTTDTPGCRDLVKDGVNGFLVPARNSDALVCALRRILDDPDLGERLGAEGRKIVLEKFDEKLVFSQTLNVYRELVHEFGPIT